MLIWVSVCVRLVLVVYGEWQDARVGLHYTDIDYLVFSDAAALVAKGESPYRRPTYRYSPILAMMLVPNEVFGRRFGKLLFVLFDVLTGVVIRRLVGKENAWKAWVLWDFNPFVINISTRGNSDSITAFMLVVLVYLLERERIIVGGLVYGVAVHMRIFPVFFGLTLLLRLKWRIVVFGVVSFGIFSALNCVFYAMYGYEFVYETYLYHLVRSDYKHNFAAPWLPVYAGINPNVYWGLARIAMVVVVSVSLWNDLRLTWAVIVLCFIAFNTVCTVQYFDWAIALLALLPEHVFTKKFCALFVVWLVSHLAWLGVAYQLEFRAQNVFIPLWCMSVLVFIGNNGLIYGLLSSNQKKHAT